MLTSTTIKSVHRQTQWAWAKIARARQHDRELDGRMQLWRAAAFVRPEASISADRLSWEVRLRMETPPPLSEWALIVGDVIHNLRSALDVLVWAHAQAGTLTEAQQRGLAFPVIEHPDAWAGAVQQRLRSVAPDVIERIRECQPFNRPEPERPSDGLLLLHDLDIDDKHRLALSTDATLEGLDVEQAVEFHDEDAASRNLPSQVTVHAAALEDGVLLMSGETKDPIKKIKGELSATYRIGVQTARGFVPARELLDGLAQHVMQVVGHLR